MKEQTGRVIILDIETAPNLGYIWGKWEQNVIEYTKEWYMLGFAYKVLGEKRVHSWMLPDFPGYDRAKTDDRKLCAKLWEVLDDADVVIAHNGDAFDMPKSNARFLAHGMTPPSSYKTVDTKKVAKRHFRLNSNKLDDIGNYLGVGRKLKHDGFETWTGCMAGDRKAWALMRKYNVQDIALLESIYLKLRPWMTNHPNMSVFEGRNSCPACKSTNIQSRGFTITKTGRTRRWQCQDCGYWSLGKTEAFVTIR
jgi:DNA polymerase elongation subunit (family B)